MIPSTLDDSDTALQVYSTNILSMNDCVADRRGIARNQFTQFPDNK